MRKKITLLLLLISLVGFGQTQPTGQKNTNKTLAISEKSIKKELSYLASDELKGRKLGSEGIEKAAQYLEKIFKKNKLKPYFKTYRDSFAYKGEIGYNIIAYKEGSDPELKKEMILLGAHYDHLGVLKPVAGDSIANGANDNAAGTTAILQLANYFSKVDTKRSLLFVLFSGEEEGLIGSTHLARRLKKMEAPIYVMLNYEMVGVPLKNTDYTAYLTGYHKSNLAEKFNAYAGEKVFGFFPKAQSYQLFKRSDNYAFYQEMGIPAQTLSTFDFSNFEFYHKVGDEAQLMDFTSLKNLIEETIPGIQGMADSEKKEIRMNPEE